MSAPDKNWLSFANEFVGARQLGVAVPPTEFAPWADTLKFSNASGGDVQCTVIQGGQEDCVDLNNGSSHVSVYSAEWRSGGQYVATIKGACRSVTLGGIIAVHGAVVDVDIDNYSDQNHGASSDIHLNFRTVDGSPVTWRSLKGCRPTFADTGQTYKCKMYLPWVVGMAWDRLYQLAKLVRIAA